MMWCKGGLPAVLPCLHVMSSFNLQGRTAIGWLPGGTSGMPDSANQLQPCIRIAGRQHQMCICWRTATIATCSAPTWTTLHHAMLLKSFSTIHQSTTHVQHCAGWVHMKLLKCEWGLAGHRLSELCGAEGGPGSHPGSQQQLWRSWGTVWRQPSRGEQISGIAYSDIDAFQALIRFERPCRLCGACSRSDASCSGVF